MVRTFGHFNFFAPSWAMAFSRIIFCAFATDSAEKIHRKMSGLCFQVGQRKIVTGVISFSRMRIIKVFQQSSTSLHNFLCSFTSFTEDEENCKCDISSNLHSLLISFLDILMQFFKDFVSVCLQKYRFSSSICVLESYHFYPKASYVNDSGGILRKCTLMMTQRDSCPTFHS